MNLAVDAIYENGVFRPVLREVLALSDGQRVRLTVINQTDPDSLHLAMAVYDGLSDKDINEIEKIALDRNSFFNRGSAD